MGDREPRLDEWSVLYQAAMDIREMAPWEWMEETELFGVENPETGDLGFVSVMGALGDYLSIAVYRGAEGLYGFWGLLDPASSDDGAEILSIPHLQATFADRSELTERDRVVIKQLGLKFRGHQAWPMFRSYRPGYFPYYVEGDEARFLTYALRQTLDMAPRVMEYPEILEPGEEDDYLVRVPREEAGALIWEDQVMTIRPPEPKAIPMAPDIDALGRLKQSPRQAVSLEIDMRMAPVRIGERGARLRYVYQLLVVESESGFVLGSELLMPDPTPEAMYGRVPATVAQMLARAGIVPWEVRVRSRLMVQLLESLADDLGFSVIESSRLPALDRAMDFATRAFM